MSSKMRLGIQIIVLFLVTMEASAQQDSFLLSGRILDGGTKEPISIASLQYGMELILLNVKWEFQCWVRLSDHLFISHTAYKPKIYMVEAKNDAKVEMLLKDKLVDLSEVDVTPLLTEDEFKQEMM